MAKITYTDKVDLTSLPVPNINKVTADNLNEIKTVVNGLDSEVTAYSNGDGKTYLTLVSAMAVDPLPADNIPFTIQNATPTADDGKYIYLSSEGGGYLKVGEILQKATEIAENNTDVVTSNLAWEEQERVNDALNFKANLVVGKNIYNPEDNEVDKRVSTIDGTVFVSVGNKATSFLDIKSSQAYKPNTPLTWSAFYDVDKIFISSLVNTTGFTTPANAVYFRTSASNAVMDGELQIEEGTVSTDYEAYNKKILTSDIKNLDVAVMEAVDNSEYIKPTIGINLYNYKTNLIDTKIVSVNGNTTALVGYQTSDYIDVLPNADYITRNTVVFSAYYDENKIFISAPASNTKAFTTPANASFIRICSTDELMAYNTQQFEIGTVSSDFNFYKKAFNHDLLRLTKEPTIITAGLNDNGEDFTGNTAIQDAIDSITDASPDNKYVIKVSKGVYSANVVADYTKGTGSSISFVQGADYIDVAGVSKEECVIFGFLPDNLGASFPYSSYQPVFWNSESELKNFTVIGQNVRYPIHIESAGIIKNKKAIITNCEPINLGNTGDATNWSARQPIGLGTSSGQELLVRDTTVSIVTTHNNINFTEPSIVTYKNCDIIGSEFSDSLIGVQNLGSGVKCKFVIEDCNISGDGVVDISSGSATNVFPNFSADKVEIDLNVRNNYPLAVKNNLINGQALRITSTSIGSSSTVRFDESSTAFVDLISDILHTNIYQNRYLNNVINGYQYKDGGNSLSGYAIGYFDVSDNTDFSLGKRLGDCSVTSKTLSVSIDATNYNIVFNTDLTNATNASIIAIIDSVIGGVATTDLYAVGKEYYPNFKGVNQKINDDSSEILAGMGVVFTDYFTMRKATNADGRIDGIALDDCAVGQKSRVIKKGQIYTSNLSQRFRIKETTSSGRSAGDVFGISATAGVFELNASPTLLKCKFTNVVEIV